MDQSLSQTETIVDENRVELIYIKSNITNLKEDFNDLEANCTEKIQELQGIVKYYKILWANMYVIIAFFSGHNLRMRWQRCSFLFIK